MTKTEWWCRTAHLGSWERRGCSLGKDITLLTLLKGLLSHLRKFLPPPKLTKLQSHQGTNPPLRRVPSWSNHLTKWLSAARGTSSSILRPLGWTRYIQTLTAKEHRTMFLGAGHSPLNSERRFSPGSSRTLDGHSWQRTAVKKTTHGFHVVMMSRSCVCIVFYGYFFFSMWIILITILRKRKYALLISVLPFISF